MKVLLRIILTVSTFFLFASQAAPQDNGMIRVGAPFPRGSTVTGAPYSAELVHERVQTLADGTHITQKANSTTEYRDSQGRMRIESSVGKTKIVEIHDPVSGFRYLLDMQSHIAHRFAPPEDRRNSVNPSAANSIPARGATAIDDPAKRPQTSTESLGSDTIEGVLAEGKKTTTTFPVGVMGNDRPMVRVMESWISPDLKISVLSKTSDPRMGESTTRLQNISRAEPDPSLFRVPAEYQVVDETGDQVEIKSANP